MHVSSSRNGVHACWARWVGAVGRGRGRAEGVGQWDGIICRRLSVAAVAMVAAVGGRRTLKRRAGWILVKRRGPKKVTEPVGGM